MLAVVMTTEVENGTWAGEVKIPMLVMQETMVMDTAIPLNTMPAPLKVRELDMVKIR